jgi:hypothetical protein
MSSTDTIINILPPLHTDSDVPAYKDKGDTVTTEELKERPILRRDNTGLRNFINDIPPENQRIGYDGEVDTFRLLGRIYTKILTYSIVTRYAFYIFPVALLLSIPLIIFGTVKKDADIEGVKMMGLFVWLEII